MKLLNNYKTLLKRAFYAGIYIVLSVLTPAAQPAVGDSFPDLSTFGLEGTLPEIKGKVVLVDFFASWCGPCKSSFPVMEELQRKYGPQGFTILAINVDKKRKDMDAFLRKHPVSFPVLRDPSSQLVAEVKISTMPSSFLLDKQGKVRAHHSGFDGEGTRKKYVAEIESLLK